MKNIFGIFIILATIWLSAYTFSLFPWTAGVMEWWQIPHLVSVVCANLFSIALWTDNV
jgi:hypothetical protein